MAFVSMVILFFIVLIVSNLLHRIIPKLPLPLIQIFFGFLIGFFAQQAFFRLNTEVFLALIVAPLLFRDGEESDVPNMLKHKYLVVYLAFIAVFVTVFTLGFTLHTILPFLPIAACCAIGASLGPTDVIAAGSITKNFDIPKRIINITKAEGLINDASGITTFQFAILALSTGAFSAPKAGLSVLVSAVGGGVVGLLISWANRLMTSLLEELDARDVTGYLILEIFLPFISFFIAEELHVSGIIAAVVSGVLQASRFKKITLFDAQLHNITNTVWNTIEFVLNAVVFILLGIELHHVLIPIVFEKELYDVAQLILAVLVVTFVLFATRFLMLLFYYLIISQRRRQKFSRYVKDILLITFSGVKGTVSIATILMTPEVLANGARIPSRNIMVFVTAASTLLSFFVGIFVLPRISQKKESHKEHLVEIAILEEVVTQLEKEAENKKDKRDLYAAVENYRQRIKDLIVDSEGETTKRDVEELRLMMLQIEQEGVERAYTKGELNELSYEIYKRYTRQVERFIIRKFVSSVGYYFIIIRRVLIALLHRFKRMIGKEIVERKRNLTHDERKAMRTVFYNNTKLMLEALENLEGVYEAELLDYLQRERIRQAELLHERHFIDRIIQTSRPTNTEEMMRGYYIERKLIFEYEERGLLQRQQAMTLRRNVNTLESYSLKEDYSKLPYEFFDYIRND